eukprot:gene11365-biopygen2320
MDSYLQDGHTQRWVCLYTAGAVPPTQRDEVTMRAGIMTDEGAGREKAHDQLKWENSHLAVLQHVWE